MNATNGRLQRNHPVEAGVNRSTEKKAMPTKTKKSSKLIRSMRHALYRRRAYTTGMRKM
jgi:hypothetical protein